MSRQDEHCDPLTHTEQPAMSVLEMHVWQSVPFRKDPVAQASQTAVAGSQVVQFGVVTEHRTHR